jgi:excinuclease ABC subunit C
MKADIQVDIQAALQQKLARAPVDPGVYLMKDPEGAVIYVGKARNLKKRLGAYFTRGVQPDLKTGVLVSKIAAFDTIVTRTEKEALILESNLIKRYRPRYNVILKDDKRYPALRLNVDHPYPTLGIVRKIRKDNALYFGPFASAGAVRQTLKIVNKTFKLRKCTDREFKTRTRPCLNCQMQGCLAPCCREVDPQSLPRAGPGSRDVSERPHPGADPRDPFPHGVRLPRPASLKRQHVCATRSLRSSAQLRNRSP